MNNNKRSNSINPITLKVKVMLTKAMDTPLIFDDNPGLPLDELMAQNPAPETTPKKTEEKKQWHSTVDQKILQDVQDIVDTYIDRRWLYCDDYFELTHCLYDLVKQERDRMEDWMRMIAKCDQAEEEKVREEGITRCTPEEYLRYLKNMDRSRVELYKIIRDKLVDDSDHAVKDGEDNE